MRVQMNLMGPQPPRETAQAAFSGARYYRTDSGVYLKDFGRGDSDDSAKLYSGQMLDFDGDDDVITDQFTVSGVQFTRIMTIKTSANFRVGWNVNGAAVERFYIGHGLVGLGDIYAEHGLTINDGNYHRIVLIRDGDTGKVYLDGVLGFSFTGCGLTEWTSLKAYFGSYSYGTSRFVDGFIGNVQIWNAAFDADDVEYDYLNCYQNLTADNRPGTSLTPANLKGHWPLIESSGDVVYDYSGNGNHGTLTNFPTDDSQWSNASALDSPLAIQTALCEWGMGSNELLYSEALDTTYWSVYHLSITDNEDGSSDLEDTGTAGDVNNNFANNEVSASAGDVFTISCRVKKISGTPSFRVLIAELDSSNNSIKYHIGSTMALTDDYVKFSHEATLTESATAGVRAIFQTKNTAVGNKCRIVNCQLSKGTRGAYAKSLATRPTNALVPIRSWETAGQFKRDYSELNFNGRSYADCGNGADVNPSTAVVFEYVIQNKSEVDASRYGFGKGGVFYSGCPLSGTYLNQYLRLYIDAGNLNKIITLGTNGLDLNHCVVVYDSTSHVMKSFINGVLYDSYTFTGAASYEINKSSVNMKIGDYTGLGTMIGKFPLFKMWIDSEAQAIIDGDLDAWVAKRYAKAAAKYNL